VLGHFHFVSDVLYFRLCSLQLAFLGQKNHGSEDSVVITLSQSHGLADIAPVCGKVIANAILTRVKFDRMGGTRGC